MKYLLRHAFRLFDGHRIHGHPQVYHRPRILGRSPRGTDSDDRYHHVWYIIRRFLLFQLIDPKPFWGLFLRCRDVMVLIISNNIICPLLRIYGLRMVGRTGYGTAMILSYFVGSEDVPHHYPLG